MTHIVRPCLACGGEEPKVLTCISCRGTGTMHLPLPQSLHVHIPRKAELEPDPRFAAAYIAYRESLAQHHSVRRALAAAIDAADAAAMRGLTGE